MAYTLRAVIARCGAFDDPPAWIADSAVIALPQGLCMVPLTEAVRYAFGPAERPWLYETHSIFTHLPEALVPHLRELSRGAPVAYVEAEYHGGDGEQRSIVWQDGAPLGEPEESAGAINDALRRLGVEPAEGADRFDTLGLGRHRGVDDWLQSIRPARRARGAGIRTGPGAHARAAALVAFLALRVECRAVAERRPAVA